MGFFEGGGVSLLYKKIRNFIANRPVQNPTFYFVFSGHVPLVTLFHAMEEFLSLALIFLILSLLTITDQVFCGKSISVCLSLFSHV